MTKMNRLTDERQVESILSEWNVNILMSFMALVIYFVDII